MEFTNNGVPMFDGRSGLKYEMWSIRTRNFLEEQGYDIWYLVVTIYDSTKKEKTINNKELKKNNKIAMDFIWEGLPDLVR
jgi:hypothetical protein